MTYVRNSLGFLLVFLLAGCTNDLRSQPDLQKTADPLPVAAPNEEILSRIGNVGQTQLDDGSCGLFLWSRIGNKRVLVTVLRNDSNMVRMQIDNQNTLMPKTLTEGRALYGLFEKTYFAGEGLKGEVTLDSASVTAVPNGATVKRASLSLRDQEGYALSLPLGGLIACQVGEPGNG